MRRWSQKRANMIAAAAIGLSATVVAIAAATATGKEDSTKTRERPASQAAAPGAEIDWIQIGAQGGRSKLIEGSIEPARASTMSSQLAGEVELMRVREGDRVKAGELLARVRAPGAAFQAQAAQSAARSAEARSRLAKDDFERQRKLMEQGFISPAAFERAKEEREAQSQGALAQSQQAQAEQARAGFMELRAPYDAVISKVWAQPGELALPGKPLVELFDPKAMRLEASAPQSERPRLEKLLAQALSSPEGLEVELASGAQARAASIRWVPEPGQAVGSRAQVELQGGGAGLSKGELAVAIGRGADQIWLPRGAISWQGEWAGAWVKDERGRPRLRVIKAIEQGDRVRVISGLAAGESVARSAAEAERIIRGEAR